MKHVVIVGGGLVGGVSALLMQQLGFQVTVLERRSAPVQDDEAASQEKSATRRSINLALSRRGQEALKAVGLLEVAMCKTVPMYGRAIHVGDGTDQPMFQRYDETDKRNYINSISREGLLLLLLQTAERRPNVTVLYSQELVGIDKDRTIHLKNIDSGKTSVIISADLILGCDGAYSNVRDNLMRLSTVNFSREYIDHSYKELEIRPCLYKNDYQLKPPYALHIWPRGDFMMIALPNPNRSFTCTMFAPNSVFESLESEEKGETSADKRISAFFEQHFPGFSRYAPDYLEQFKTNRACRLVMTKVDPWCTSNTAGGCPIVLLGDAAHAMVPFYGQGMNAGMEDALELYETLKSTSLNLNDAIQAFAAQRAPRGRAIQELSLRNYLEMRSHTASRLFLFRKKLEGYINVLFPQRWIPLYKMVAFTRTPYDEAIVREEKQDAFLKAMTGSIAFGFVAALALAGSIAVKAFTKV